jgi:hypothetical protein
MMPKNLGDELTLRNSWFHPLTVVKNWCYHVSSSFSEYHRRKTGHLRGKPSDDTSVFQYGTEYHSKVPDGKTKVFQKERRVHVKIVGQNNSKLLSRNQINQHLRICTFTTLILWTFTFWHVQGSTFDEARICGRINGCYITTILLSILTFQQRNF